MRELLPEPGAEALKIEKNLAPDSRAHKIWWLQNTVFFCFIVYFQVEENK